jgi:hypothetical protein
VISTHRLYGSGFGATIVAACINLRPELFGAVVTDCGIFDLLKGSKDVSDSVPDTSSSSAKGQGSLRDIIRKTSGDPSENAVTFSDCLASSPLHNVPTSDDSHQRGGLYSSLARRDGGILSLLTGMWKHRSITHNFLNCTLHSVYCFFRSICNQVLLR